jgi:hypothetical protein
VSNSALLVPRSFPHFSTIAEETFVEHRSLLPAITGEHYQGGHWLGTFALTTGAGLAN